MDFWRQMDIVSPTDLDKHRINIIGVGGIGSPTALALTKMGINKVSIFDDDKVEDHNLPNQIYRKSDLGKSKVEGAKDICKDFSDVDVEVYNERFESQSINGIVISGVDSMKSRSIIWKRMRMNPAVSLYIDARMGAEVCKILTVNPCNMDDVKWYESPSNLFPDDKASEEKCTEKAIIYNTFMIASLISSQVKKYARAQSFAREIIFDLGTLTLITN